MNTTQTFEMSRLDLALVTIRYYRNRYELTDIEKKIVSAAEQVLVKYGVQGAI